MHETLNFITQNSFNGCYKGEGREEKVEKVLVSKQPRVRSRADNRTEKDAKIQKNERLIRRKRISSAKRER